MSASNQNLAAGLPHDIRGLLPYETPWWHYALAGLLGVVVLALLGWCVWMVRPYLKRKTTPKGPDDPWEYLEKRLQALSPPAAFPVGPVQEDYFFQVSLLLREGIELRTGIRATDLTLYELKGPMRKKMPLAREEIEHVIGFLERADMVKFAGTPSNREEALSDLSRVTQWILELRPRPLAPSDQVPQDPIFLATEKDNVSFGSASQVRSDALKSQSPSSQTPSSDPKKGGGEL